MYANPVVATITHSYLSRLALGGRHLRPHLKWAALAPNWDSFGQLLVFIIVVVAFLRDAACLIGEHKMDTTRVKYQTGGHLDECVVVHMLTRQNKFPLCRWIAVFNRSPVVGFAKFSSGRRVCLPMNGWSAGASCFVCWAYLCKSSASHMVANMLDSDTVSAERLGGRKIMYALFYANVMDLE